MADKDKKLKPKSVDGIGKKAIKYNNYRPPQVDKTRFPPGYGRERLDLMQKKYKGKDPKPVGYKALAGGGIAAGMRRFNRGGKV